MGFRHSRPCESSTLNWALEGRASVHGVCHEQSTSPAVSLCRMSVWGREGVRSNTDAHTPSPAILLPKASGEKPRWRVDLANAASVCASRETGADFVLGHIAIG